MNDNEQEWLCLLFCFGLLIGSGLSIAAIRFLDPPTVFDVIDWLWR